MNDNPSIMSHISIGTNNFEKSAAFYDAVMPAIGAKRVFEPEGLPEGAYAIAYGKQFPEFWINTPHNGEKAEVGNGAHYAFFASSQEAVHNFWDAAIKAGAIDEGEPGPRPHYGAQYYGCFVLDPDGHKIEAMFWDESAIA